MDTYGNRAIELADKVQFITDKDVDNSKIVDAILNRLQPVSKYAAFLSAIKSMPEDNLTSDYIIHQVRREISDTGVRQNKTSCALFAGSNKKGKPQSNNSGSKLTMICYNCNKPGHMARDCRSPKGVKDAEANVAQIKPKKEKTKEKKGKTKKVHMLSSMAASCADTIHNLHAGITNSDLQHHWILDSGVSCHMTGNANWVTNKKIILPPVSVTLGDNTQLLGTHYGDVTLDLNGSKGVLKNVLYIPKMCKNLLSAAESANQGLEVVFTGMSAIIQQDNKEIGRTIQNQGLYILQAKTITQRTESANHAASTKNEMDIWHSKLGHIGFSTIKNLVRNKVVIGLPTALPEATKGLCIPCTTSKHTRSPTTNPRLISTRDSGFRLHRSIPNY